MIEQKIKEAKKKIERYIDDLCIIATFKTRQKEEVNKNQINEYLKKRGYTINTIQGRNMMTKGFVCVSVNDEYLELWHDTKSQKRIQVIDRSILTSLPIALNYMERI